MRSRVKPSVKSWANLRAEDSRAAFTLRELHVIHDDAAKSAALNMAVDEALLELARTPTLRFYGWRRPSVSFGYFCPFAEVSSEKERRELVRRWTGGGVVLHGTDLTYSLIFPRAHDSSCASSRQIYSFVHSAIHRALRGSVDAVLAVADAPKVSDACFANPVAADVLVDGRKIAGAAQRRTRAGLLQQGSIQCDELPIPFRDRFASELCPNSEARDLSTEVRQRGEILAETKYATRAWLEQR